MISHAAINIPLPDAEQTLAENHNSNLSLGAMRQGAPTPAATPNGLAPLEKTFHKNATETANKLDKFKIDM